MSFHTYATYWGDDGYLRDESIYEVKQSREGMWQQLLIHKTAWHNGKPSQKWFERFSEIYEKENGWSDTRITQYTSWLEDGTIWEQYP